MIHRSFIGIALILVFCFSSSPVFAAAYTDTLLATEEEDTSGWAKIPVGGGKLQLGSASLKYKLWQREYHEDYCFGLGWSLVNPGGVLVFTRRPTGLANFNFTENSLGDATAPTPVVPQQRVSAGMESDFNGSTSITNDGVYLYKNVFLKERPNFLVVDQNVDSTLSEGPFKVFNGIRGNDPLNAWSIYSFAICKKKIAVCGDLMCDDPEDATSCAMDCGSSSSSSSSSMPSCNNDSICDAGEDSASCPSDCLTSSSSSSSSSVTCNNDAICDEGEDMASCPGDCMATIESVMLMCTAR